MQLRHIPIDQSINTILAHNIVGADGHKVLAKGHVIRAEDVETFRAFGKETVYVAVVETDDVREDDAAVQLARIVAGDGIELSKPSGGRVNFLSSNKGFLSVNRDALKRINELNGVTLATKPRYASVAPKEMIATLKTIGLALPTSTILEVDKIISARGKAIELATTQVKRVAIILTGSESGKQRTQETFSAPIRARIEAFGAQVIAESYTDEDADAIQVTIVALLGAGAQIIIIAGETSVMDADDITPRGIKQAGGEIVLYGAPIEPGNLLMLAYFEDVPIICAPGCIKSRETNVVDLILPRLMIGDKVTRADVIEMAEGGLLL